MDISVTFPFDKDTPDVRDTAAAHPFSIFNSADSRMREVRAIVALGLNNEIGFRGDMPWHIPEDLRRFKQLTLNHPVIMGRATWLSLPRRPLPGRRNIVISRNPGFRAEGAETALSLSQAVDLVAPPDVPYIIGGGQIYSLALPLLSRIDVTRVNAAFPDADTFFPEISEKEWRLADVSEWMISSSGHTYRFETYLRK